MNQGGRVCKFFLSGSCKNGNKCNFEHPQNSGGMGDNVPMMNTNPGYEKPNSGSKSSICSYFQQGKCTKQKCQ